MHLAEFQSFSPLFWRGRGSFLCGQLTQRLVCPAGRVSGLTFNTLKFSDEKAHVHMGIWGGSVNSSSSLFMHLEAGHD